MGKTKMIQDFKSYCKFTNDKENVIKGVVMVGTSVVCDHDNTQHSIYLWDTKFKEFENDPATLKKLFMKVNAVVGVYSVEDP